MTDRNGAELLSTPLKPKSEEDTWRDHVQIKSQIPKINKRARKCIGICIKGLDSISGVKVLVLSRLDMLTKLC